MYVTLLSMCSSVIDHTLLCCRFISTLVPLCEHPFVSAIAHICMVSRQRQCVGLVDGREVVAWVGC